MVVHRRKRETVHNKKLIHLNEQVVIELVWYKFFHMKKARGFYNIHPRTFQMSRKTITLLGKNHQPFFHISQSYIRRTQQNHQFHIGLSQHITQNQPYSKIREEYHMDNPYHQTTKTTQDHEDDGIMQTEDFWGREFIQRHLVLCFIFDRGCVIIFVSFKI